jgi:NAD(P)-dependent dehydrogenase (short-subunit alcohol dehydrogenase family)
MKTYLVVGASSGIGKQIAINLVNQGHRVIGTYNNNDIELDGIEMIKFDASDNHSTPEFDTNELSGLIYCPGTINLKPFRGFNEDDFINDYKINVTGAIRVIKKYLKQLKATENSSILFFSTVAVQNGFNFHSQVASSKGAIEGLTRSLAAEFAPNIRVNAIAPSLTDTPLAQNLLNTDQKKEANANLNPLKKIGDVNDIADMAVFLTSEKSKWISGQIIHIDGGMSSIK